MLLARGGEAAMPIGGFVSYCNVSMGLPAFGLHPYSQLACRSDTLEAIPDAQFLAQYREMAAISIQTVKVLKASF